ncbi:MAG: HEAT repeat domain-containing protein [Planctomycetes bacterium]|nr:HEAT repeat domain-containing protein [Planctomycetota bacterium]
MQSTDALYVELEAQRECLEERWCLPWCQDRQQNPVWRHPLMHDVSALVGGALDDLIARLLGHGSFALHGIGLHLIAEHGRPGFTDRIRASLDNPSLYVRALGAVAIGRLGDVGGLELLLDAKDNEHPEVKKAIVDSLRAAGDTRSIPLLARWIGRVGEDDELRRKACQALGTIGDGAAMPVLSRVIEDDTVSDDVRRGAACAVGQIGGADARKLLLDGLRSPRSPVRAFVAEALLLLEDASLALRLSTTVSGNGPVHERCAALGVLVRLAGAEGARSLDRSLVDEEPGLRAIACGLLIDLEGRDAAPRLVGRLDDDDDAVRAAAVAAYGRATGQDFTAGEEDLDGSVTRALAYAANGSETSSSENA